MRGYLEQFGQRGHRPRGDHVKLPFDALGLAAKDSRAESERFAHLVEKFGAKSPGLDQRDRAIAETRDDNPGKSCTGPNVDPRRFGARGVS
jgi:hypothetical protein